MFSRTPHACTAGPQQRDGKHVIKETLHLGKHGRLLQICIEPVDRVRRGQLSRGCASYIRPKRRHACEPYQSILPRMANGLCGQKFRVPTLRFGAGHSCRFRIVTA